MKNYVKPIIVDEEIEIADVVLYSVGEQGIVEEA